LLVARQEITEACTAQAGRLRALLLAGDDTDRRAARTTPSGKALAALAGRDLPAQASREQAVCQAEIRRLAEALGQARRQLKDNRAQLLAIVEDIAPPARRRQARCGLGRAVYPGTAGLADGRRVAPVPDRRGDPYRQRDAEHGAGRTRGHGAGAHHPLT